MIGLIIAGASAVMFAGLYAAGIVEARRVDPARPLPRARVLRRRP